MIHRAFGRVDGTQNLPRRHGDTEKSLALSRAERGIPMVFRDFAARQDPSISPRTHKATPGENSLMRLHHTQHRRDLSTAPSHALRLRSAWQRKKWRMKIKRGFSPCLRASVVGVL